MQGDRELFPLSDRPRAGDPPPTLFEYLPENALLIVDESHVTVPQIGGMFKGDFARKTVLAEFGFRLPSCIDNRPLKFEEWERFRPMTVFVSATPGPWEMERTAGVFAEQVIRPTGLIDPVTEVRPVEYQVDDLLHECKAAAAAGGRVLVTTLTKRMAEQLTDYLTEQGVKVRYLHSDIDTLERIEIIRDLRLGVFDVLVGINLLREGLDIPECSLVAILDADKEGFLRSQTSLIQTIGRAARNIDGRVMLYADTMTRIAARRDRGDRAPPQQAAGLERGPRHHADFDPAAYRQGPGERVRAGLRDGRAGQGCGDEEFVGKDLKAAIARSGKADARGGGRSGVRAGGAVARRDQAAGSAGARPAGAAGGDRDGADEQASGPEPMGPGGGGYDPSKRRGRGGMRRRGP